MHVATVLNKCLRLGDANENDGLLLACPRANQDGILLGKACVIFQRLADQAIVALEYYTSKINWLELTKLLSVLRACTTGTLICGR
jgi:hypothetical protein